MNEVTLLRLELLEHLILTRLNYSAKTAREKDGLNDDDAGQIIRCVCAGKILKKMFMFLSIIELKRSNCYQINHLFSILKQNNSYLESIEGKTTILGGA